MIRAYAIPAAIGGGAVLLASRRRPKENFAPLVLGLIALGVVAAGSVGTMFGLGKAREGAARATQAEAALVAIQKGLPPPPSPEMEKSRAWKWGAIAAGTIVAGAVVFNKQRRA